MAQWAAMLCALGTALLCAARRIGRGLPRGKALAGLLAANILYGVLYALNAPGRFLLPLLAGEGACLLWDVLRQKRELVLPEACLYLCVSAAFAPLCLGGGGRLGFYPALTALFVEITLWQAGRRCAGPLDFYPERRDLCAAFSAAPCAVLLPEAAVLAVFRAGGEAEALALCCAFLALLYVALLLQEELCRRVQAEEFSRAAERWQSESRDYINTIRSQRHDFNLHLHAISGLLATGSWDECSRYVSDLVAEAGDVNDIMPVSDAVVGSMLFNMRQEARRRGSDITYDITYDMADTLCSGFACNKIIGNLLQNAIDALHTPEDRACGIRLSIFKRRGNTVIISENRFTGDPAAIASVFEPGYSTKKGHEGIGLNMALRTAAACGGRIYPEFDGELIRFVVNLPNKVNLPEGGGEP